MFAYTKIMQGIQAVSAAVTDAYFNLVTLLLPGNGTNGAQNNTFLDSSTNNFSITRNGNTTQGTFTPFSQTGWSNYFDNSANYRLTIPDSTDLDLTGDFCFEGWFYFSSLSVTQQMVCLGSENASQNGFVLYVSNSNGTVTLYSNGAAVLNTSASFTANEWQHVALVRSGSGSNNLVVYRNGVSVGTATNTTSFTGVAGNGLCIGQTYTTSYLSAYSGYVSNVRLVKGSPVYTSAFTPSTTPLTAITNTVLLTCQSNRFIDTNTQVSAKTITVTGSPSVQAFSPFAPTAAYSAATNGGSGYFDGTGDYLSIADNAAFNLSGGNYTIEGWFYFTGTYSAYRTIVAKRDASVGTNCAWEIYLKQTSGVIGFFNGTNYDSSTTPTSNAWNYFAAVFDGTNMNVYLNGSRVLQTAITNTNYAASIYIGSYPTNGENWIGYFGDLRITKGAALYSGLTMTVPTSPLTTTVSSGTVSLLTNYTNAGITDATAKNDLETVGNAQISTTQSKFGGSSMYFDGTGDYLIPSPNAATLNAFGSGDFTLEMWAYAVSFANADNIKIILDFRPLSTDGVYPTIYFYSGQLRYFVNSADRITGSTLSTGQWYHIAVCRSGTSTKMFLNGTQDGSTYTDSNSYLCGANRPVIGCRGHTLGDNNWNGYIDDLRISRYARYTANFTPPAAPFPVQ